MSDRAGSRQRASSFGAVAANYHGARTTYSAAALDWALAPAGPGRLAVLDLAAGTGLLTAALEEHRPPPRIVAVEPDPGMRAEYDRHAPDIGVLAGTAEAIPVPDSSADSGFDAVLVGTAFHWFDPVRALPEIARVLRDGGVLAALWTGPDDSVGWVRDYRRAGAAALRGDAAPEPDRPAGQIPAHPLFTEPVGQVFAHLETRPLAELIAAVATYSDVLTAPPERRERAVAVTAEKLRARLDEVGPADPRRPDTIAIPVAVRVLRCRRRPRT